MYLLQYIFDEWQMLSRSFLSKQYLQIWYGHIGSEQDHEGGAKETDIKELDTWVFHVAAIAKF